MKELISEQVLPVAKNEQSADAQPAYNPQTFSDILDTIKTTTIPQALPRTDLIMTSNLKAARQRGLPFYTAAKVLEHYGRTRALPPVESVRVLTKPDTIPESSDIHEAIEQLVSADPYTIHATQRPWEGVVQGQYQDMFGHIPSSLSEARGKRLLELGKEVRRQSSSDIEETMVSERQKDYRQHPEKYYARSLWQELLTAGGIEKALVTKLLSGDKGMNASDYHTFLHTSLENIPALGGEKKPITPDVVADVARRRVTEDIGDDPTELLRDKSLSMLYEELTGEHLWDYQTTTALAGFFMDFHNTRNAYHTWNKNAKESPDAMLQAFVARVIPEKKGEYRVDPTGRRRIPKESAGVFVKDSEEMVLDRSNVDDVLGLSDWHSPLMSQLKGTYVPLTRFEKEAVRLQSMGTRVKYDVKPTEEVIGDTFAEVGLDQADPQVQFDVLAHSASDIKGWLGAHRHLEKKFSNEDYFNQAVAIKEFLEVQLWKEGVKRQGWVPKDSKHPIGHLESVATYFRENPAEWTYRKHAKLYEGWSVDHIAEPKVHKAFADHSHENPLEKLNHHRSRQERYALGVKQLLEAGQLPDADISLHALLTEELFPFHQTLAAVGVKPEDVPAVLEQLVGDSLARDPLERLREASRNISELVDTDTSKLRYLAQYEMDKQVSDRVMARTVEARQGKEAEMDLTRPIIEVECGDSRNEARRVALESSSESITTVGAAGHFGVPFDAIRLVPTLHPEAQTSLKAIYDRIRSKEKMSQKELLGLMKTFGAETVEEAKVEWEAFNHWLENPYYLSGASVAHPGLLVGGLAVSFANFTLGDQLEHLMPGAHAKFEQWIEKNREGDMNYTVNLMKLDPEKYGHLQEQYQQLLGRFQESKDLRDLKRLGYFEKDVQSQVGADYVEGLLHRIGLDLTKWNPASGEHKILALAGHGAKTHGNNLDSMAYECGACGGHTGGHNAAFMAQLFNDTDVQNILRSRGIDIHNTSAISGIYTTTTSEMRWHIPKDVAKNEAAKPLIDELLRATSPADDAARLRHEKQLTGGVHAGFIDTVKKHTVWKVKRVSEKEQERRIALGNAHARSVSAGAVQPEGGNGWATTVDFSRHHNGKFVASDTLSNGFHVNSVTTELPPAEIVNEFAGVAFDILSFYNDQRNNSEEAPWKAQQDWYYTGPEIFSFHSAGDQEVFGGLSRQMLDGRRVPSTRPIYHFTAGLDVVQETLAKAPDLRQIMEQDYGMVTVFDPHQEKVFRYVSPAHKKVLTGQIEEGSWEEVPYLSPAHKQEEIPDEVVADYVLRQQ